METIKKFKIVFALLLLCFGVKAQTEKPEIFFSQTELTASGGQAYDEFYWLNSSSASLTKTGVSFTGGTYRFDLSAYAVSGSSQIGMYIDGNLKGTITVGGTAIAIYSLPTISIAAGSHTVKIQINNFSSGANHCRVGLLYFTKTTQTAPYVYPALTTKVLPANGQYLTKEDFGGGHLRGFNEVTVGLPTQGASAWIQQCIPDAKATGANVIRQFLSVTRSGDVYSLKAGELLELDSLVIKGARNGIYIIPVMELDPDFGGSGLGNTDLWGSDASHVARKTSAASLWAFIANRYKNNTWVGAYDIWNEPRSNFNYAEVIKFQTQCLDSIRSKDANHVVLIECISNDMFAMMLPLGYTNIVYSPHGYSTLKITHQGVGETVRNAYPLITSTANLTAPWNITNLSQQHDNVRIMSRRFHVPVFIGEFSCVAWAPASTGSSGWSSTEWINDNITLLEAEGWSWAYHNFRGGFTGWEPEVPPSYLNGFSYTNAAPTGVPTWSTLMNTWRNSTSSPTIQMLKGWFALNGATAPAPCSASTYYFSSTTGDDQRSISQAHCPATPWKSIDKLNQEFPNFQPGNSVLFKRGETFYGSINVAKSGTASKKIVIGAYGVGDKPIISGWTSATNFTQLPSTNVWESGGISGGLSGKVNMVAVNNVVKGMGRFPNLTSGTNGGYNTIDWHSGAAVSG